MNRLKHKQIKTIKTEVNDKTAEVTVCAFQCVTSLMYSSSVHLPKA